jgi:hypothetical protein
MGYGFLLSDSESGNWLDTVIRVLGLNETLTDTVNNWLDFLLAGYGNLTSDQLVLTDSQSLGYGFLLSDSESGNWDDFVLIGYGSAASDQLVIVDSLSSGYGFLLSDNLNNWLDLVETVVGIVEVLADSESANWSDSLQLGYGNLTSDALTLSDQLMAGYGNANQ